MRILHFFKTSLADTMGGIEQAIDQIARGTAARGAEVDVLTLTAGAGPRSVAMNGYVLHLVPRTMHLASTGISLSVFSRFAALAKQADIIHYHFPWPLMDMVHFATRVQKPSLVTYHSDIIRQNYLLKLYRPLQWKFLEAMDHIVATSPNYLATSDVLARYRRKTRVIPLGLDKASYPVPDATRLQFWRERFSKGFFLFVGAFRYYKGLHILVEAARGAAYPVVIAGAGPIEAEIRAQARRLGVQNLVFLGLLPDEDKVALLQLCHAIVFPSHMRAEAFGISLLEGAMFGKPMISSEIGTGTTFVNIGTETGLVVPPGDAGALRRAMDFLWQNPARAAEMGERAEARYRRHFTATQMNENYMALYTTLMRGGAAVNEDMV
jgi:O-antigen biosynthesis rhamnosyltransferase